MALLLFVDDEADTLQMLKKGVEMYGHQAVLASTAAEAMQQMEAYCPDLVFVDMRLPDMDGLELLLHLQQDSKLSCFPVIVLSAWPELDASDQALAAGAREYLLKPVRLQTLLNVINKYIPNEKQS